MRKLCLFLVFLFAVSYVYAQTCTDSDGGVNPFIKGNCTDSMSTSSDSCVRADGSGPVSEGSYVSETFCLTQEMREYCKRFNSASYCDNLPDACYNLPLLPQFNPTYFELDSTLICPNGCSDGACILVKNETCTDSDGGKNYYVKGYVYSNVGLNAPESGWDECLDGNYGYVYSAFQDAKVSENFCGENNMYKSEIKDCPYGCSDGACVVTSQCSDSDGTNYYTKGYIRYKTSSGTDSTEYDYCSQTVSAGYVLNEMYCYDNNTKAGSINTPCPAGYACSDGACILVKNETCTDSDGGINIFVKGIVYGGEYKYYDKCVTPTMNQDGTNLYAEDKNGVDYTYNSWDYDSCSGNNCYIAEAFCHNGWHNYDVQPCPNGCSDGACIEEAVTSNLAYFPYPFITDGVYTDTLLFVGANAPASDTLAMVDVATMLQYESKQPIQPMTRLDSEFSDPQFYIYNILAFGSPCDNKLIGKIAPEYECGKFKLDEGNSIIKSTNKFGRGTVIVSGATPLDTRKAAKVLANYEDYDLKGQEVCVTGTSFSDLDVKEGTCPHSSKPAVCGDKICEPSEKQSCPQDCAEEKKCSQGEQMQFTCADGTKVEWCACLNEKWVCANSPESQCPSIQKCDGCYDENKKCLPYGTRTESDYCETDGNFYAQAKDEASCQNNYECQTNLCIDGKCMSKGVWNKFLSWLKAIFS